jgi:hypothetical protein
MKNFLGSAIFIGICLIMGSCSDDSSDKIIYNVKMTDGPGPYSAVNIDLRGVEITGNGGSTVLLNTNSRIYNLLNFSNGVDTLIATGGLEMSSVEQIRLILGDSNTIVVNNQTYPLSTPSADQSGLKLQVHQTLEAGVAYNVLLDFDATKSIVEQGNGQYKLKPVIRTIETATSGAIKGSILPKDVNVIIEVIASNSNSYTTVTNSDGKFIVQGLPPGSYTVSITPVPPLIVVIKNNVNVTIGSTTDIGQIQL